MLCFFWTAVDPSFKVNSPVNDEHSCATLRQISKTAATVLLTADDFQAMTQFVSKTFAELMKLNSASLVRARATSAKRSLHLSNLGMWCDVLHSDHCSYKLEGWLESCSQQRFCHCQAGYLMSKTLQVGVIQFSTGTNVHLPLDSYTSEAFDQAINDMVSLAATKSRIVQNCNLTTAQ